MDNAPESGGDQLAPSAEKRPRTEAETPVASEEQEEEEAGGGLERVQADLLAVRRKFDNLVRKLRDKVPVPLVTRSRWSSSLKDSFCYSIITGVPGTEVPVVIRIGFSRIVDFSLPFYSVPSEHQLYNGIPYSLSVSLFYFQILIRLSVQCVWMCLSAHSLLSTL